MVTEDTGANVYYATPNSDATNTQDLSCDTYTFLATALVHALSMVTLFPYEFYSIVILN